VATAAELFAALDALGLVALAVSAPDPEFCPAEARSLVLIGPQGGAKWWGRVTASPEWADGAPDPIDRWSNRHLGALAARFGGAALFPSEGPPWPPFFRWALESGRVWQSPVGMLVHADQGLWVSFRGALALPFAVDLPEAANPCLTCAGKPCTTACPVKALSPKAYDTAACHAHLDRPEGRDCLTTGCAARRACPAGESHARMPEQSRYHMSRFHP
jgi:ferredoxin